MEFDINDELMDMYKILFLYDHWERKSRIALRRKHPRRQSALLAKCDLLKLYACNIDQDLWVDLHAMSSGERTNFIREHKYLDWFVAMEKTYPEAFSEWCDALLEEVWA